MQVSAIIRSNCIRKGKTLADTINEYVASGYRIVDTRIDDGITVIKLVKHVDTRRYRLG